MPSNPLIFIIDDDKFCHVLLCSILKKLSISNIQSYYSGQACLENIDQEPSLVLLDYEMNGMNGLETLHKIKAIIPDSKVLMISSRKDISLIEEAIKRGADNYLVKNSELPQKLTHYLNRQEALLT